MGLMGLMSFTIVLHIYVGTVLILPQSPPCCTCLLSVRLYYRLYHVFSRGRRHRPSAYAYSEDFRPGSVDGRLLSTLGVWDVRRSQFLCWAHARST